MPAPTLVYFVWFEGKCSIWIITLSFLGTAPWLKFNISVCQEEGNLVRNPVASLQFVVGPLCVWGRWAPCCRDIVGFTCCGVLVWLICKMFCISHPEYISFMFSPINFAKMRQVLKKQGEIRTNLVFFPTYFFPVLNLHGALSTTETTNAANSNLFSSGIYLFNLNWFNKLFVMSHLAA